MNDIENGDQDCQPQEYRHLVARSQKDSGNGIVIASAMIGVSMVVSSIAYAVVAQRYPPPAAPAVQTTQDQGDYAPSGYAASAPSPVEGPSCGVQ